MCKRTLINPHLPEAFFVTRLPKGVVSTPPPPDFLYKALILMIWILEDRYESLPSIDTKNVQVAFVWRYNGYLMTSQSQKPGFYRFSLKCADFQIFTKNPRKMRVWWGFLLIMKEKDYFNTHWKFQVHSTSILVLGAKTEIGKWQPPPLPLTLTAYSTSTPG